jgi:hypothetical protein
MKLCGTCKQTLQESNFSFKNKQKNQLSSICKKCHNKYAKKWYHQNPELTIKRARITTPIYRQRNINYVNDYKSKLGCKICYETCYHVLDFHHTNNKEKCVSRLVHEGASIENIIKEIIKCIVVCANCHRKIHAGLISF